LDGVFVHWKFQLTMLETWEIDAGKSALNTPSSQHTLCFNIDDDSEMMDSERRLMKVLARCPAAPGHKDQKTALFE
jgi:hypothetical protein